MLNIVLFGPPGAGKGTQAQKLISKYKLVHLSTGDIFRSNIKGETELGNLAKSYMDKGELVPDKVTIQMLEKEVNANPSSNGFIFDGFPRTTHQALALDEFLNSISSEISLMIALEVPKDELIQRLLLRGKESQRADDQDKSIIENRIRVYLEQTAVVANHYMVQDKFCSINGLGAIHEITERLFQAIDQ